MPGHSSPLNVLLEQSLIERRRPQVKSMMQKKKGRWRQMRNNDGRKSRSVNKPQSRIRCDNIRKSIGRRRRDGKNRERNLPQEKSRSYRSRSNPLSPAFFFHQSGDKQSQSHRFKDLDERYNSKRLPHSIYYQSHVIYSKGKNPQDRSLNYHKKKVTREKCGHVRDHRKLTDPDSEIESSNALSSVILRDIKGSRRNGNLKQKVALRKIKPLLNIDCSREQTKIPNPISDKYTSKQILNLQKQAMTIPYRKIHRLKVRKKAGVKFLNTHETKAVHEKASNHNSGLAFLTLSRQNMNPKKHRHQKIGKEEKSKISFPKKFMLANYGNPKVKFSKGRKGREMLGFLSKHDKSVDRKIFPQWQRTNSSTESCFQGHRHFPSHSKVIEAVVSKVPNQINRSSDESTEESNPNSNRTGDIKILQQEKQARCLKSEPEQSQHTISNDKSDIFDIGKFSAADKNPKRYALPKGYCRTGRDSFSSLNSLGSADLGSWGTPEWWCGSSNQQEKMSKSTVEEQNDDDHNEDSSQEVVLSQSISTHQNTIAPDDDKTAMTSTESCENKISLSDCSPSGHVLSSFKNVDSNSEINILNKEYSISESIVKLV